VGRRGGPCDGCPLPADAGGCPFYDGGWGRRGACVPAARRRLHLLGVVRVWPGVSTKRAYALLGLRGQSGWLVQRLVCGGFLRRGPGRRGRSGTPLFLTERGERLLEDSTRRLGCRPGPTRRRGRP